MLATSRPIEKIAAGKVQRNDDMVLVNGFDGEIPMACGSAFRYNRCSLHLVLVLCSLQSANFL